MENITPEVLAIVTKHLDAAISEIAETTDHADAEAYALFTLPGASTIACALLMKSRGVSREVAAKIVTASLAAALKS